MKFIKPTLFFLLLGLLIAGTSACATKTGCKINDSVHSKTNRDGSFSSKPGSSSLFPGSRRKR